MNFRTKRDAKLFTLSILDKNSSGNLEEIRHPVLTPEQQSNLNREILDEGLVKGSSPHRKEYIITKDGIHFVNPPYHLTEKGFYLLHPEEEPAPSSQTKYETVNNFHGSVGAANTFNESQQILNVGSSLEDILSLIKNFDTEEKDALKEVMNDLEKDDLKPRIWEKIEEKLTKYPNLSKVTQWLVLNVLTHGKSILDTINRMSQN